MKAKTIAKRMRSRADTLRRMAQLFKESDQVLVERAKLMADVLAEVADQVSPPSKKSRTKH